MKKTALTIAGSDPSGGAGIQADLKVFQMRGVCGMAVPAALTAQCSQGVADVMAVPGRFFAATLDVLLGDIRPDALKTGMLLSAANIRTTARFVSEYRLDNLVVDPVMVSTSGHRLLRKAAVKYMVSELFPLAVVLTPNADEASLLTGMSVQSVADAKEAAVRIHALGPGSVLVKGGHLAGEPVDVLYDGSNFFEFASERIDGIKFHGTGCVLSAAITAGLASGMDIRDAVGAAKEFILGLMRSAVARGEGRVGLV